MTTDAHAANSTPDLDLTWLDAPTEWGIRARPGKRGLTLDEISTGTYGAIPADAAGRR